MSKHNGPQPLKPLTEDETCPVCGQFIDELWECFTSGTVGNYETYIECLHCGAELKARQVVDVRYQLSPADDHDA